MKKTIEELTQEIEAKKEASREMQAEMKKASEIREGEAAEYQQAVADQRFTQIVLQKAITRMSQVYALVQQPGAPHIQTSGTHTDPGNGPARFAAYGKSPAGARVIAMLEEVLKDSRTSEDDCIAGEQDAQVAYE